MTQPDEPTIPGEPQKAHGDALEELVDATPEPGNADDDEAGERPPG
jgi:hypothetical protein